MSSSDPSVEKTETVAEDGTKTVTTVTTTTADDGTITIETVTVVTKPDGSSNTTTQVETFTEEVIEEQPVVEASHKDAVVVPMTDIKKSTEVVTASEKDAHKGTGKLEIEEHVHVEMAEEIDEELEKLLHTDHTKGLTTEEAAKRLEEFGRNEIAEVKHNPLLKFLPTSPVPLLSLSKLPPFCLVSLGIGQVSPLLSCC